MVLSLIHRKCPRLHTGSGQADHGYRQLIKLLQGQPTKWQRYWFAAIGRPDEHCFLKGKGMIGCQPIARYMPCTMVCFRGKNAFRSASKCCRQVNKPCVFF